MYLYEHFASFKGFYDASFGLGGDYVKSLAYYYSMSPLMWINFACIWGLEHTIHINPHDISFWPTNQLVMAYVRTVITLIFYFLFVYVFEIQTRTYVYCNYFVWHVYRYDIL